MCTDRKKKFCDCILQNVVKRLRDGNVKILKFIMDIFRLVGLLLVTLVVLILWQPVTAICKFFRDGRYETSEGTTKVLRHKEKRYTDLAASRGDLIEGSIEAVFEPMVQGYIIFPSIIDIFRHVTHVQVTQMVPHCKQTAVIFQKFKHVRCTHLSLFSKS